MKNKWNVIHDCDGDDGRPACWAKEINHPKYGRYVWISRQGDTEYAVEVIQDNDTKTLMTCRSLASAKRWAAIHIG